MEASANTLVTLDNLDRVIEYIQAHEELGFDTETYGLNWGKQMFSMQIACGDRAFYFNFHDYDDGTYILNKHTLLQRMKNIFTDLSKIWYIHNAKFDMHRLAWENIFIMGRVRDTVVWSRLVYNQYFRYDLGSCLKRIGMAKDDAVEKYIAEHKLYTMIEVEGKATKVKDKYYWLVPFQIMYEYGCMDAVGVLKLGQHLHKTVEKISSPELIQREEQLTKVCAEIEDRGAVVDLEYVQKGWEHEQQNKEELYRELSEIAGRPFKNGPKWLSQTFDEFHIPYERNEETGNPIFDKAALAKINNPIANKVKDWRRADKYIGTYYSSFKRQGGLNEGIIHANIRTGGTDTLRFSYSDPNLQNVPKEDSDSYEIYVRKCITPRPNYNLVAIDFRQQEFRLMLDYANEKRLIEAVNAGEDLHTATANLVGCTRKQAKVVNFGLLYGMGVEKLAATLGISVKEAQDLKFYYFAKLPRIEAFIDKVISTAKTRKYIKTWTGRYLRFPDREFCYKAPNHLIQGGCADMVREAMVQVAPKFEQLESGILIQVHDELVYEIHKDEMDIVPELRDTMKDIYTPFNGMLMDCSVEVSGKSWGYMDMQEIAV